MRWKETRNIEYVKTKQDSPCTLETVHVQPHHLHFTYTHGVLKKNSSPELGARDPE